MPPRKAPRKTTPKASATSKPATAADAPPPMAAGTPAHDPRKEWKVVKLTGVRVQQGRTASGMPKYAYEVEWEGNWANSYETRENLLEFAPRSRRSTCRSKFYGALPSNLLRVPQTIGRPRWPRRRLRRRRQVGGWVAGLARTEGAGAGRGVSLSKRSGW